MTILKSKPLVGGNEAPSILKREPALIIGTIATIIIGAIATLSGNGFVSDVAAGKATDIVNSIQQLLVLLAPIITASIVRGQVFSPASVTQISGEQAAQAVEAVLPYIAVSKQDAAVAAVVAAVPDAVPAAPAAEPVVEPAVEPVVSEEGEVIV